ncbi:MAG: threonine/serine dehydratase [Dehalococcoidia bacterium]|jgi:threonine dehydratase|nr:threonine ammonia-lyase [Chloroflexota bacterium]MDP6056125.1 threonine/serine dehydratase [Dehalococcoidia bacterium]MDP7091130.1 threonine/serine dehydratase [Dehalococcoidia bacterium]MDP7262545.1 threonine/serine dehydratase [Dehalococcoidia bacterium]MDP7484996.1 threonine/serine dehydratase [Dehalococcoidia bacterium]|tara:strand:+ start:6129 stop:7100 length:972 start_codon:yes stop_codon:yes gene_type:complete
MTESTKLVEPTIEEIQQARLAIENHVLRTPLRHYPVLSELLDADVWIKHENFQLLGAFKVRGGINLVSQTSQEERDRGFVTASSGNHGQSIAYAARTFGAACTVVLPEGANSAKAGAIAALGANVIFHGDVFERSKERAAEIAERDNMRAVHAANEPALIAGVATYSVETYEDLTEIDVMIVPIGAGSGASGACIVTDSLSPLTHVIGVQAADAPAAYHAWKSGEFKTYPMTTVAEGLATESAYSLPIGILRERLKEFVLVKDSAISAAIQHYVRATRTLVEHAGAASLAAGIDMKEQLKGKRVVLVASGGNITTGQLRAVLN